MLRLQPPAIEVLRLTLTEKTQDAIKSSGRRTVVWICSLATTLGFLEAWLGRNEMNSDGVSYLDLADAFAKGDWAHFINGYWSPLYPALLGMSFKILHPSTRWQFPVTHLVNFLIYLATIVAFHYFITGVIEYQHWQFRNDRTARLSETSWLVLGWALFIWSSLRLITLAVVSPDLAVAGCAYFAAGALLRTQLGSRKNSHYVLLGLALGIGYLAKAPMFPLAVVFLAACALGLWKVKRPLSGVVLTVITFIVVAGPFIAALARSEHRLTFGDSATLNYVWYVNHIPRYHWNGQFAGMGASLHPTTRISETPVAYSFDGYGTYPIWENPVRWYEGIKPHLSLRSIGNQIVTHAGLYFELFWKLQSVLIVCLAALLLVGRAPLLAWRDAARWPLWPVAVAPFVMYAAVHVEPRMIAPFVVLFWIGCFAAVSLPRAGGSEQVVASFTTATAWFLLATVLASTAGQLFTNRHGIFRAEGSAGVPLEVVRSLQNLGVRRGDPVAWIRPDQFDEGQNYWWARLGGFKIVAEVPTGEGAAFWGADAGARNNSIRAFARTGVKVLIATGVPPLASKDEWARLGKTSYYALCLPTKHDASTRSNLE